MVAVLHVQRLDKPVTIAEWKYYVEAYFDSAQGIQGGPGRVIGTVGTTVKKLEEEQDEVFQCFRARPAPDRPAASRCFPVPFLPLALCMAAS